MRHGGRITPPPQILRGQVYLSKWRTLLRRWTQGKKLLLLSVPVQSCLGHMMMCVSMAILDWVLGSKLWDRFSCRKFAPIVFRREIYKVMGKTGLGWGRHWPVFLWLWDPSWCDRKLWSLDDPQCCPILRHGDQTFVLLHEPITGHRSSPWRSRDSGSGRSQW